MTEHLTACPICGCDRYIALVKAKHHDQWVYYDKCPQCDQVYLNPRMTDQETIEYYRGTYRDLLGGVNGVLDRDIKTQQRRAKAQVQICAEYLKDITAHLEIGCSAGYLLEAVGAMRSVGVEPDARYHQLLPACKYTMVADVGELAPEPFDLISMSHVLEHINHPVEYLSALIERHAHKDTQFLIEVPNGGLEGYAPMIHHPYAFTWETLARLFYRVGFLPRELFLYDLAQKEAKNILTVFWRGEHDRG